MASKEDQAPPVILKIMRALMITRLGIIVLALGLVADPVLAATIECRSIQSRKDRNACYEQQQKAKETPAPPKMNDPIETMKLEDDRLTKRLQGICRGC